MEAFKQLYSTAMSQADRGDEPPEDIEDEYLDHKKPAAPKVGLLAYFS